MPRQPAEKFPPGAYISEEVEERDWTAEFVCKRLGISGEEYESLLRGEMRLDGRLSCLCGALFGTSDTFFAHLEMAWRR